MTSWWGWALRRARASTGLLLTLLALVTATTAILSGAAGYSGAAATTAAREALAGAVPAEAGIRVQTRQSVDAQAQDAAARRVIAEAFDPAPVSVQRTVATPPRPASLDGSRLPGSLVALASESLTASAPGVQERVEVVEGSWPQPADGAVQGMLHAGTAAEWDVTVGDALEVGGTPVAVVGLWRPVDADDAFWFGDQLVAAGRDGDDRGPLVLAPGSVVELVDAPFARWTVQPDATRIQPDDLAHLASAAESLRSSLKTPEVEVRGVTVDGDLAPTAATASHNLATASALGVIPLSVLALVTLLSVTQLARLLSTTREAQSQLLVARGATRAQVLLSTIVEAAVVTVAGAALGGLLARAVLLAVPAGEAQGGTVARVAAVSGLAVLVVLAVVALVQVWRLTTGGRADLSGRTRTATALATLVLVLGAAAVAWWQLRRTGSPLVTQEDGTLGTDLVAGAAPALLLAAAAVVAMALLGPLGRAVEALTRPGRRAPGHLAAAQVSRRLPVYAVPAVLTVLAVGATTLAGLYSGTSSVLRDNLSAVGQGAPVRATLDEPPRTTGPGVVPPPPALPSDLEGAAAAAPVWLDPDARIGDLTLPVTMAAAGQLAEVASLPDLPGGASLVPVAALTAAGPAQEGVPVPEGTEEVVVALDVDLTISEDELEGLQAGYEQSVKDVQEGVYGEAQDEDAARSTARQLTDNLLVQSLGQVEWQVTLQLVEEGSGIYHEVDSAPVTLDLPSVLPGWLDLDRLVVPEELPEGTTVDYTQAEVRQGGGTGEVAFSLPEGTQYTLTGVRLSTPRQQDSFWGVHQPDVDAAVTIRTADGTDLLGEETAGWGSAELASPEAVAQALAASAEGDPEDTVTTVLPDGSRITSSVTQPVLGALDTSGTTWTITADSDQVFPDQVTVGPGLEVPEGAVAPGHLAPQPGGAGAGGDEATEVPVALTAQTARAASLAVGDRAELSAFGARLPVRVAAVVPAVPGTLAPRAALLDRDAVAAHHARAGRTLPYPDELWVMPDGGVEAATPVVEQLAAAEGVTDVVGPGRVAVTDATSAARLVFWVASAGAVLLAVIGIGAVAATLLGHRRPEVAVLRALGMPPRAQARSRALELGGVVLVSIGLGLAASWLVGRAVVPELARSTTLPGQVALPSALVLEPGLWAALLGVGLLAVLAVVLLQAGRVRAQALDADYREEIR